MILGGIEIQILTDLARLRQDMTQARSVVNQTATSIRRTIDSLQTALGAIGVGLSAAAFANWIKGAIDAGDATKAFSQKTGIAAEDVAGLQLAFRQGGVEGDELAKSLGKLGREMVEGNKAFRTLGVETRNADGSMRSIKDVLYDTADAFAATDDAAVRTTLAQELFGKSGAALIPTLTDGSQGLRDMADMAEKLGLVISGDTAEAADKFNDTIDLLGQVTDGMGRRVAAQVLPTLNNLAGALFNAATEGDTLSRVSDGIAEGLKVVFSAGAIGIEVFNTFGKMIGGVAGALMAVAQGELRQAQRVLEESGRDIVQGWGSTAKMVEDAWTGAGGKTVETTAAMVGGMRQLTPATKEQEEATKKAADAAKKHAEEQAKLRQAGVELVAQHEVELAALRQQLVTGKEVSDGDKEWAKVIQQVADKKVILTAAQLYAIRASIDEKEEIKRLIEAEKERIKTMAEVAAHSRKLQDAQVDETATLREAVVALREQNETAGMSSRELAERTARTYEDQAATKEWQAAMEGGNWQLEEQARLLRERAQLTREGVVAQEAKEAASEWKKTTEQLQQGLTDAFYRAFESGKGFFSTLWEGIKNTIKATSLRVVIDAVMRPINAGLGALLGGAPGAAGAGQGGGLLSGLGSLGSVLGSLGSTFGAGVGMTMSGWGGTVAALEGAGAMIGSGQIGAGIAQGLGALGPYVAAAAALYTIYKKLDRSGTPHQGSVVSIGQDGTAGTRWGDSSTITNNFQADTDKALRALGGASVGSLNRLARAFDGVGGFSGLLRFAADGNDASIGSFGLWRGGSAPFEGEEVFNTDRLLGDFSKYTSDPTAAWQAYANDVARWTRAAIDRVDMPAWAREQFAKLGDGATIEQFAATTDAVIAMQQALQALRSEAAPFGGVFTSIATLSSDALKQLTDFAGGIEAFGAKVRTYIGAYYSEAEQAAIAAGTITRTLSEVGIDASMLTTRAEFRALVDSRDVTSEQGRKQMAALLDVAGAFAGLADYMGKTQGTALGSLAALAPVLPSSTSGTQPVTDRATALAAEANQRLTAVSDASARSAAATESLVSISDEGFAAMLSKLSSIDNSLTTMARDTRLADLSQA